MFIRVVEPEVVVRCINWFSKLYPHVSVPDGNVALVIWLAGLYSTPETQVWLVLSVSPMGRSSPSSAYVKVNEFGLGYWVEISVPRPS
jgi:hypothetical protein